MNLTESSANGNGQAAMTRPRVTRRQYAAYYVAAGFSVIPVKANFTKKPAIRSWKAYIDRLPTDAELDEWFLAEGDELGIAVVGGPVSGNLLVIDIDLAGLHVDFEAAVERQAPGLLAKLVAVRTPRGEDDAQTRHYWLRYDLGGGEPIGNLKLATGEPELVRPKDGAWREDKPLRYSYPVRIETRGAGGYVIAPGSPREVHRTRREYKLVGELRPHTLPVLSRVEVEQLLEVARTFHCHIIEDDNPDKNESSPEREARDHRAASGAGRALGPAERLDPSDWPSVEDRKRRCKAYLVKCDDAVAGAGGHDATFHAACEIPRFGLDGADAMELLRWWSKEKSKPSWPQWDLDHKLADAIAKVQAAGEFGSRLNADSAIRVDPLTDVGNAEELVRAYAGRIRYVANDNTHYWFDGTRWAADDRLTVESITKRAMVKLAGRLAMEAAELDQANDERSRGIAKALRAHAKRSNSRSGIENAIKLARSAPGVATAVGEFDADPMVFNVANGTIELATGAFRNHDSRDLLTKCSSASYDPGAACPTFDAFLKRVVPDAELRAFIQTLAGLTMIGEVREHVLIYLHGGGRNGKSTLLNLLMNLFGDYSWAAPTGFLETKYDGLKPYELAELRGRRIVVASECESGAKLAESGLKFMTGGDLITGARKYGHPFSFKPSHTFWSGANHLLKIRGQDLGIWRRILLIPFAETIRLDEVDPLLPAKLQAELSGVLNWALAGLRLYLTNGLQTPASVVEATEDYKLDEDELKPFVDECCEIGGMFRVPLKELYARYRAWAFDNGRTCWTDRNMSKGLSERGYHVKRVTGGRVILGLRLREDRPLVSADNLADPGDESLGDFWGCR